MKPFTTVLTILFLSLQTILGNGGKYGMPKDCVVMNYDRHPHKKIINLRFTSFYNDKLGNYYYYEDGYKLVEDIDYANIVNIEELDSLIESSDYGLIHESKGKIHIPIVIIPDTVDIILDIGFGNWNANRLCGAHTFPLVSVKINSELLFDGIPAENPDCNSSQDISSIHFDLINNEVEIIENKWHETYKLKKTSYTFDFNTLISEPLKDLFSLE